MSPVGFEPTISAGERPQTYALDRAATGTGNVWSLVSKNVCKLTANLTTSIEIRFYEKGVRTFHHAIKRGPWYKKGTAGHGVEYTSV